MNNTSNTDIQYGILDWITLAEITISMLATLWTSYKLGHLQVDAEEIRCCGKVCCLDFHIQMESDSEKSN